MKILLSILLLYASNCKRALMAINNGWVFIECTQLYSEFSRKMHSAFQHSNIEQQATAQNAQKRRRVV